MPISDTKTGHSTLTLTVSSESIGVAQLQALQFPDWVPNGVDTQYFAPHDGAHDAEIDREEHPDGDENDLGCLENAEPQDEQRHQRQQQQRQQRKGGRKLKPIRRARGLRAGAR